MPQKIYFLFLLFCFSCGLDAAPRTTPDSGYPTVLYKQQSLAANATASYRIPMDVCRWSIYQAANASYTLQATAGTGFKAASSTTWLHFTGAKSVENMPVNISSGTYLWMYNGATAQMIRMLFYGQ